MSEIKDYEYEKEKLLRERNEHIVYDYLMRAEDILSGKVKPYRVHCFLSRRYAMTRQNIAKILIKAGVYKDSKHPIMNNSKEQSLC